MSQMPPPPAPPSGPPPMYQPPPPGKPQGMAIASMVLGVVGLLSFCNWRISIPCAVLAIVLGFVAKGKIKSGEAGGDGMVKAGIILGFVSVALSLIVTLLFIAGVSFIGSHAKDWEKKLQDEQRRIEQQQQQQNQPPQTMPVEH
jgi:hypothetical protein